MEASNGTRRRSRTFGSKAASKWSAAREFIVTVVVALMIATLVRTFIILPFYIPSMSMYPTLHVSDKILVSKLEPRFLGLHRGDVIVFKDPGNWISEPIASGPRYHFVKALSYTGLTSDPDGKYLVKRAIGLPGDTVECDTNGGTLTVNDQPVDDSSINPEGPACNYVFSVKVPEGQLWVMGDNRADSADSAYHYDIGEPGFVPVDNVQGKAIAVFWPISHWSSL